MGNFRTIENNSIAEIEEKRSKFIASAFHVNSVNEAEKILTEIKKKYHDARHNCYAYIVNEDVIIKKASDDGEPSRNCGCSYFECFR